MTKNANESKMPELHFKIPQGMRGINCHGAGRKETAASRGEELGKEVGQGVVEGCFFGVVGETWRQVV